MQQSIDWPQTILTIIGATAAVVTIITLVPVIVSWFTRNRQKIKLTCERRLDFEKRNDGRYLIRLSGSIHNTKGQVTFIDKVRINCNTLPWMVPEEITVENEDNREELQIIKVNDFNGAYSTEGRSHRYGSYISDSPDFKTLHRVGELLVFSSSDRKPPRPSTMQLHTSAGWFSFKITDVTEHLGGLTLVRARHA